MKKSNLLLIAASMLLVSCAGSSVPSSSSTSGPGESSSSSENSSSESSSESSSQESSSLDSSESSNQGDSSSSSSSLTTAPNPNTVTSFDLVSSDFKAPDGSGYPDDYTIKAGGDEAKSFYASSAMAGEGTNAGTIQIRKESGYLYSKFACYGTITVTSVDKRSQYVTDYGKFTCYIGDSENPSTDSIDGVFTEKSDDKLGKIIQAVYEIPSNGGNGYYINLSNLSSFAIYAYSISLA